MVPSFTVVPIGVCRHHSTVVDAMVQWGIKRREACMLLTEEEKVALVHRIIDAAKVLLAREGTKMTDPDTGFEHLECRRPPFVMVEHQRQTLSGGTIKTNGLDLWQVVDGNAKKLLSATYIPFAVKFFHISGKAPWIQEFITLAQAD